MPRIGSESGDLDPSESETLFYSFTFTFLLFFTEDTPESYLPLGTSTSRMPKQPIMKPDQPDHRPRYCPARLARLAQSWKKKPPKKNRKSQNGSTQDPRPKTQGIGRQKRVWLMASLACFLDPPPPPPRRITIRSLCSIIHLTAMYCR